MSLFAGNHTAICQTLIDNNCGAKNILIPIKSKSLHQVLDNGKKWFS